MRYRLAAVLVAMSLLGSAYAQDTPASQEALIEQVITLSGLQEQVDQIPAQVQATLQQMQSGVDPQAYAAANRMLPQAYRRDALHQSVKTVFRRQFNQEKLSQVLAWLSSPLVRKITRLEGEAAKPEALQDMQAFAASLPSNPPSPRRSTLIEQLDETTDATKLAVDTGIAQADAMVTAFDAMQPPEKRSPPKERERTLQLMRQQAREPTQQFIRQLLLFSYRTLTDEEVQQYLGFYQSDVGRWFHGLAGDALREAMVEASARAGQLIAAEMTGQSVPQQQDQSMSIGR